MQYFKKQMSKLAIVFVLLFVVFSFNVWGSDLISTPVVTAINSSTYTAITTGTQTCYGFGIVVSDGSAFYIAVSSAGAGAALMPAGTTISWPNYVPPSTVVMYVKSVAGTPNLILLPAKKVKY